MLVFGEVIDDWSFVVVVFVDIIVICGIGYL